MKPKRLQGGAVFMSTGWPPFRYIFCTTLQSGSVFFSNMIIREINFLKVEPFSKMAPRWSQFGSTFFSVIQCKEQVVGFQDRYVLLIFILIDNNCSVGTKYCLNVALMLQGNVA